jgi:N-acetylmuramic acid 6-phosphate (MurNAc-6-P) etherase
VKNSNYTLRSLLKLKSSSQAEDYVAHKRQFQLHSLVTEQRHPNTWNLSFVIKDNIGAGLRQILSVDADISRTLQGWAEDTEQLEHAAESVRRAVLERKKIFIYGCGATGRLAKQMESALWRPFWTSIKSGPLWTGLRPHVGEDIEARLIGEMTGGDRALISSLEGFEDLELVGQLQLEDRGIEKGDMVIGITEGGETSSVLGALRAALDFYGGPTPDIAAETRRRLYLVYNNPDDVLRPFHRSRTMIEHPGVSKINLTTGPQAIAGSTRMQAATIETFVVGAVLEAGIKAVLRDHLTEKELMGLGFNPESDLAARLMSFAGLRETLDRSLSDIVRVTGRETDVYKDGGRVTYFARSALISVFIDCAERSPTFHLAPLDTVGDRDPKCWLQVWTEGADSKQAWRNFLGRRFFGLDDRFYRPQFMRNIRDPYLRSAALSSLSKAGRDQESRYDFSFSTENLRQRGPQKKDLGILVCIDKEIQRLTEKHTPWYRFVELFKQVHAAVALILVGEVQPQIISRLKAQLPLTENTDVIIPLPLSRKGDPLNLNRQTLIKMLLNAHSTGVMARLGRVVGNTMTDVHPSNLKLIGRATHLILSHVNDTLLQKEWIHSYGGSAPVSYDLANAVLFEAMEYTASRSVQVSEVALSIIRILETLKDKHYVSWEEALFRAETEGLEHYLERNNPALRQKP